MHYTYECVQHHSGQNVTQKWPKLSTCAQSKRLQPITAPQQLMLLVEFIDAHQHLLRGLQSLSGALLHKTIEQSLLCNPILVEQLNMSQGIFPAELLGRFASSLCSIFNFTESYQCTHSYKLPSRNPTDSFILLRSKFCVLIRCIKFINNNKFTLVV